MGWVPLEQDGTLWQHLWFLHSCLKITNSLLFLSVIFLPMGAILWGLHWERASRLRPGPLSLQALQDWEGMIGLDIDSSACFCSQLPKWGHLFIPDSIFATCPLWACILDHLSGWRGWKAPHHHLGHISELQSSFSPVTPVALGLTAAHPNLAVSGADLLLLKSVHLDATLWCIHWFRAPRRFASLSAWYGTVLPSVSWICMFKGSL